MEDLHELHRTLCPKKYLGNFWKSVDYKAAASALTEAGVTTSGQKVTTQSAPGRPSTTEVHPVIALAFVRWSDAHLFYGKLARIIAA